MTDADSHGHSGSQACSATPESSHDSTHSHDHDYSGTHGGGGSTRTLAAVAFINLLGFAAELAGGLLFGSVALLSDAVHMLFDALAYVMAFAASFVAERYDVSNRWSYGLHRLEPLAAFLNGMLLVPMVGYILWESYRRFLDPVSIGTVPTLAIAFVGLAINVGSVFILHGGTMSLNEKGAYYHLIGDAGGSIAVIVAVLAIQITGIRIIDPITAGLIAIIVLWSAWKVLKGSGAIFLIRTPIDQEQVRADIQAIEGVERVTDLHAWQICSQITVATTHVETTGDDMTDAEDINRRIHQVLADHEIDHATVELCPAYGERSTHLDSHMH
ncbi:MAG: cation diffusion facilitator family transporter [Halodesulfurarchaeum sp.]